jgi:hypothetical protein
VEEFDLAAGVSRLRLPLLLKLNQTTKEREGRSYWHVAVTEVQGELFLNLSKVGEKFPLTPFKFEAA